VDQSPSAQAISDQACGGSEERHIEQVSCRKVVRQKLEIAQSVEVDHRRRGGEVNDRRQKPKPERTPPMALGAVLLQTGHAKKISLRICRLRSTPCATSPAFTSRTIAPSPTR